jgi:hypothetical protein
MDRLKIINSCLSRLKQTRIEHLNAPTERGEAFNSIFNDTLDELYARNQWSFSIKDCLLWPERDKYGKHKTDIFGRHIFKLPEDFIVKCWWNKNIHTAEIMADGIHADGSEPLKMIYTFKQRDDSRLPPYFTAPLRAELCYQLTDKLNCGQDLKPALAQEKEALIAEASITDAANKKNQVLGKSDFEAAHESVY